MINDKKRFDVLGIGELNADLILTGLAEPPTLDKEVLADEYKRSLGSSTAICIGNLSALGLKTGFCGKVGSDDTGTFVLEELNRHGINTGNCIVDSNAKTGMTVSLNWNGDRALVTVQGAMAGFSLRDFSIDILANARHIHIGSFFLQTSLQKDLVYIFKKAHEYGATTSLDAGWDIMNTWDSGILDVLPFADLFLPNEVEAIKISKAETPEEAARKLADLCANVVVKKGSRGAYCVSKGLEYSVSAIENVSVVDTTGAGDSFNAGFIYGFVNGFCIEKCMEYANACGALSVMNMGGITSEMSIVNVERMLKNS